MGCIVMMKKINKGIRNPKKILLYLLERRISRLIWDSLYLKIKYKLVTGKKLNLKNPKSFNEKIQWLKLHDRKTEYTQLVDKYEVRQYIARTIGEDYLIPLLGVFENFEEIDFNALPDQFVLKPNHTSGNVYICEDKSKLDYAELKEKMTMWLKRRYYWSHREWPYKNIKPRIICEKYMADESGIELKDYKIFCFNGEPKLIQVDFDRHKNHKRNLYTLDWQYLNARIKCPNDPSVIIPKPERLSDMLCLAIKLSKNIPHVRVDLYSVLTKIYFGELTFYHGSGYEKFDPDSLEMKMGNWISHPKKK